MYIGTKPFTAYPSCAGVFAVNEVVEAARQGNWPANSHQLFTTVGTTSFNFNTNYLRLVIICGGGGPGGNGQGNGAAGGGGSAIPKVLKNVWIPSGSVNIVVGGSNQSSSLHTYTGPAGFTGFGTDRGTVAGAGGLGGGGSGSGGGHPGGNGGTAGQAGQGIGQIGGWGTPFILPPKCRIGTFTPGAGGAGGPSGSTGNSSGGVGYGAGGGGGDDTGGSGPGGGGGGILINGSGPTASGGSGTTFGPGAQGFVYVEY